MSTPVALDVPQRHSFSTYSSEFGTKHASAAESVPVADEEPDTQRVVIYWATPSNPTSVSSVGMTLLPSVGINFTFQELLYIRPAILVPYPYAADNHQEINATEMVKAGAALMIDQDKTTPNELAASLESLAGDSSTLVRMGSAMKALGRPEAAATIIDWCEEQVGTNVS